MAAIGRTGYLATCARWFGGDEEEMNRWLHRQASEREIERMVSAKLDTRNANGETCVCEELPIVLGVRQSSEQKVGLSRVRPDLAPCVFRVVERSQLAAGDGFRQRE